MTPYDDNTTRNTTDGSRISGSFNWDFNHINNRYGRQVSNATLPSTYQEHYDWPRRDMKKAIIGICLVIVSLFVATFEVGLLDGLYLWLTN